MISCCAQEMDHNFQSFVHLCVCPQVEVDNSLFGPLFSRSKSLFLTKKVKNIVFGPVVSEKLCFLKIPKTLILKSDVTPNFNENATFKLYIHVLTHNIF